MTKDQAFKDLEILNKYIDGYGFDNDAEAALRRLSSVSQINVSENIWRFREAMKITRRVSIHERKAAMNSALMNIRSALTSFVFRE